MDFDTNIEFLRMTFYQIILTAGPLLFVALIVGLIIGIIQAATTVNEMTLSFVPKIIIVVLTFSLLANYMLVSLSDFFSFIFDRVAGLGFA